MKILDIDPKSSDFDIFMICLQAFKDKNLFINDIIKYTDKTTLHFDEKYHSGYINITDSYSQILLYPKRIMMEVCHKGEYSIYDEFPFTQHIRYIPKTERKFSERFKLQSINGNIEKIINDLFVAQEIVDTDIYKISRAVCCFSNNNNYKTSLSSLIKLKSSNISLSFHQPTKEQFEILLDKLEIIQSKNTIFNGFSISPFDFYINDYDILNILFGGTSIFYERCLHRLKHHYHPGIAFTLWYLNSRKMFDNFISKIDTTLIKNLI